VGIRGKTGSDTTISAKIEKKKTIKRIRGVDGKGKNCTKEGVRGENN